MISETLVSVCLIEGDRLIHVWLYYVYSVCLTDSILPYVCSVKIPDDTDPSRSHLRAHQEPQTVTEGKHAYSRKFYVKKD